MAGLRFDKVDPRIYVELGQNVGRAYEQSQAASAGLAAQREQERYEPGTAEAVDPNGLAPEGYTPDPGRKQYGLGANPTTYQDTPYTAEQKRVAGLQGQMDYYISRGNTDKADKLREQIFAAEKNRMDTETHGLNVARARQQGTLGDLQIAEAQRKATREDQLDEDARIERAAQADVQKAYEKLRVDADGNERQLTNTDRDSLLLTHADSLMKRGHSAAAQKVIDEHSARVTARAAAEEREMKAAIGVAAGLAGRGDFSGAMDFYNRFVHDGAKVVSVTEDKKTGVITVERESADGKPLKSSTIANANVLIKGLQSFQDPGALVAYTRDLFKDHLDERKTAATEMSARASMNQAASAATLAQAHSKYYDKQGALIQGKLDQNAAGAKVIEKYNALTTEQKNGPEGRALEEEFRLATLPPGEQLRPSPGSGKGGSASANARYTAENLWNVTEQKLREADTPEARIQAQKEGFLAMRGIAPQGVEDAIRMGKGPDGAPLDEAAVDYFNRLYPNSAVDKKELPWLQPAGAPAAPAAPAKGTGLPTVRSKDFYSPEAVAARKAAKDAEAADAKRRAAVREAEAEATRQKLAANFAATYRREP